MPGRRDLPEEVVTLLVEHDLRYRLRDFADHPGEVPRALASVDAVEAIDAGALEKCVRRV
jgi:hypothetical protein